MRNERGFTLIELLVVIAILAILFGVTALALNGVFDRSAVKQDTAEAEMDAVQTAIDVYLTQSDSVTVTAGSCEVVGPSPSYAFGDYLRRSSKFYYHWGENGKITGVFEDNCDPANQLWP